MNLVFRQIILATGRNLRKSMKDMQYQRFRDTVLNYSVNVCTHACTHMHTYTTLYNII